METFFFIAEGYNEDWNNLHHNYLSYSCGKDLQKA